MTDPVVQAIVLPIMPITRKAIVIPFKPPTTREHLVIPYNEVKLEITMENWVWVTEFDQALSDGALDTARSIAECVTLPLGKAVKRKRKADNAEQRIHRETMVETGMNSCSYAIEQYRETMDRLSRANGTKIYGRRTCANILSTGTLAGGVRVNLDLLEHEYPHLEFQSRGPSVAIKIEDIQDNRNDSDRLSLFSFCPDYQKLCAYEQDHLNALALLPEGIRDEEDILSASSEIKGCASPIALIFPKGHFALSNVHSRRQAVQAYYKLLAFIYPYVYSVY